MRALVFLLLIAIMPAAHAGFLLDGFKPETKGLVADDLAYLNRWSARVNNRWFWNELGIASGSGKEWYNWLQTHMPFMVGSQFEFHGCTQSTSTQLPDWPLCQRQGTPKRKKLNGLHSLSLLDPNYSVTSVQPVFKGIQGGLVLSGGEAMGIETYNAATPVLKPDGSHFTTLLDEPSARWYRLAHYLGLTRLKTLTSKDTPPLSSCRTAYGSYLLCDQYSNGSLAVTGLLLRDFAALCTECSAGGRLGLYYVAIDYLFRIPGNKDLRQVAYQLLSHHEETFAQQGLNVERLKRLYRWALTQQHTAARFSP